MQPLLLLPLIPDPSNFSFFLNFFKRLREREREKDDH
jgi:hypothetical protein